MNSNNSDDNLFEGNLLFANGGKGVFRLLAGGTVTVDRNVVRDNAFLHGEGGGMQTSDCGDDSNTFINNIIMGNYHSNTGTKGNVGGKGHHQWHHNLIFSDEWTRLNHASGSAGGCPGTKVDMVFKNNLVYQTYQPNTSHALFYVDNQSVEYPSALNPGYNLFWGPGSQSTWFRNYTMRANDIAAQPIFANAAQGDFSLAAGSPGKNAASDGADIGITYNAHLKKLWLQHIFALPTEQKTSTNGSASFTVDPNHYYQMWFYIPNSACTLTNEVFTVEGTALSRNISAINNNTWVQAGGTQRWITLGRHKTSGPSDTSLNVSWTNASCAEKIFIRQIPTVSEAYAWISGAASTPVLQVSPSSLSFSAAQDSANPPSQTVNIANTGGGTLSWSVTDNQTWLTVSPTSGTNNAPVIVSVNTSALTQGTYNATITVTATGSSGSPQTIPVTLTVTAPAASLPLPGRIEAEGYNSGGPGVGYKDLSPGNAAGATSCSRSDDVDIKTAPGGSGCTVGYTQNTEWLAYAVNVQTTGSYTTQFRYAHGMASPIPFHLEIDGVHVGSFSAPSTGSWSTEATVSGPTLSLTAGTHTLKIVFDQDNLDLNYLDFTQASGPVPCSLYAPGSTIPAGYGVPWDTQSGANEMLIRATCTTASSATLDFGRGLATQYVYKTGYHYHAGLSSWTPITLSSAESLIASNWYPKQASASLSGLDLVNTTHYALGYLCTWVGTSWKCGCSDAACTQSYWQIQSFKRY